MRRSSFSITVIFIAISIVGWALLPLLPVKLSPSQMLPSVTVRYSMPGASARVAEWDVTSRIESALARVSGVKDIDSKSYNGGGRVTVSLDRHADLEKARFEVSALVRQIWGELPEGIGYPSVSLKQVDNDASRPFMTLTLNAPANPTDIIAYGEENLKPLLIGVGGIGKVELNGAQPMEWKLHYNINQLNSLGISLDDICTAIREHYTTEFLGIAPVVKDGFRLSMRLVMKSAGTCECFSPSDIVLTSKEGIPLTLDKITETTHEEAEPTGYFRISGLNSIYVNITADEGANQLEVADGIGTALDKFACGMPAGYIVEKVYDATDEIRRELDKIYIRTGLTIIILLLLVALVSLSIRYVLLITIGLVVNLSVSVAFYYVANVEIQVYSLAGITISLSLIIDNLIVMADQYRRRHNLEAFPSILGATLTTVGALSVVFFLNEKIRLSLQDFVLVVVINLFVSLGVALFLVPALIERLGISRRPKAGRFVRIRRRLAWWLSGIYAHIVGFIIRFRVVLISIIILAFGLPVFMMPENIERDAWIAGKYNSTFGSSVYKENIKPWVDKIMGGTLRLFVEKVRTGSYWDRNSGEPMLSINATLPNGATLDQMNALMKKMEGYLGGFSEIRQFQTSVASARRASISVFFKKEHQRDGFPLRLKEAVVSTALTLGGGSWSVYGLDDLGFSNDVRENAGSYRVKMTGYNYDDLCDWAYAMRDTLLSNRRIKEVTVSSEFTYWKDDYSEFYLAIDSDKLAKTGINTRQLFAAIGPTFGRATAAGAILSSKGSEAIRLYSRQGEEYDIFSLMNRPFSVGDKTFKISDLGRIEKRQSPQDIVKRNQEYVMCLQYEYIGSNEQGERSLRRDVEKINNVLPVGYKAVSVRNEWKGKDESAQYWLLLLVAAIIFFSSSILFNSLRQPFAIIFMIPVSYIGVFLIFYLLQLKFDQGGFASFILLSGLTVNAAIYIIHEFNTLRSQNPNVSPRKLYVKAFRIKIGPIMLTMLSTILGLIPFIVGDSKESFWYPLAVGTMGGLAMSLIAVLLILPIGVIPKKRK